MSIELLENRTLMSASAISTQVAIDRLNVNADLLKFRLDIDANDLTLLADTQTLKADGLKSDPTLKPLFNTLHKDVKSMQQALLIDRLTQKANVLGDQITIVHEQIQILKDHGNATALAADHTQLLADRVKLQNDDIAGLNARIATREADLATISADAENIVLAGEGENLPTQDQLDLQKFATDRENTITTLTSDLETIMLARTTLSNDLMALEA
jgi:hypothetical protein